MTLAEAAAFPIEVFVLSADKVSVPTAVACLSAEVALVPIADAVHLSQDGESVVWASTHNNCRDEKYYVSFSTFHDV